MSQWQLQPIFDNYLLVAAVTAALLLLLLVGPGFAPLTRPRRMTLLALRVGLILLIALAMLQPARISTEDKPQTAVLLILYDQSRSMQLPDSSGGDSRWAAQQTALARTAGVLRQVQEKLQVKVYAFDSQLAPSELTAGQVAWPAAPAGQETDLGSSLHEAVRRELGNRIAAVVVLSDGTQTVLEPKVELYDAGRQLARLGVPLYTVAFGPPGDTAEGRDVAVDNLPEQYTVFVKNELLVRGTIAARGYSNKPLPVRLEAVTPDGNTLLLGTQEVTVPQNRDRVPVEFRFSPEQPGQFQLTLSVAPQPGELVTKNNDLTTFVNVLEGGLRVAYLFGSRLGEQRYLRWSLAASPDIELDYALIDIRDRASWPRDRSPLLNKANYDVYLLENLDSTALTAENLAALSEKVEQGKGLMMIGGYHSFGPGGYQQTPLADVLPVAMGRFERQDLGANRPISRDLHLPDEALQPRPRMPHPLTQLAAGAGNDAAWRGLPPLLGGNKLTPKESAQVLLESQGGAPLLVAGEYGRGRTLALAVDSTRLWWQRGREAEHKRFWRQVILWLARRDGLEQNDLWLKLPQRRFAAGAAADFTAGARTATGLPIEDALLAATLRKPDGSREPVTLGRDGPTSQGRTPRLRQPGTYLLEITAQRNGQPLGRAQATFQVIDRDRELSAAAADPQQLARLALLTREFAGRPVAAEELPALLQQLLDQPQEFEVRVQTKWELAGSWWDAWLLFLAATALLSGEWYLRKRWGLV